MGVIKRFPGKVRQSVKIYFNQNLDIRNDMAYGVFKNLARRKASHKVLRYKAFKIAKTSTVYAFFDKSLLVEQLNSCQVNNSINSISQLLEMFKKEIYIHHLNTIFRVLTLQSISKFNKDISFLLWLIYICSKYAWVVPLKDKKGVAIVYAFQNILGDSMELHSKKKPNKMWIE